MILKLTNSIEQISENYYIKNLLPGAWWEIEFTFKHKKLNTMAHLVKKYIYSILLKRVYITEIMHFKIIEFPCFMGT